MIAALYSSRLNGKSPNTFVHGEECFGWESIEGMLAREMKRISQNSLPRVPGLKESHVFRDPWTRLNVKPAKIMQVQNMHTQQHLITCTCTLTTNYRTTSNYGDTFFNNYDSGCRVQVKVEKLL